jgi:hypothetical protein
MSLRLQGLARVFALAATIVAMPARPCVALEDEVDAAKAATVKAAYVLNFLRYSEWPDEAFETPDSPIVVALVGSCEVANVLPGLIARADPIAGHPIVLEQYAAPDPTTDRDALHATLARSHLAFVCPLPEYEEQQIVERLRGSHVLTVSDASDFCGRGGMLGFVLRHDRIVFEANPRAIQDSKVSISAKVLKLAQIVEDGARP